MGNNEYAMKQRDRKIYSKKKKKNEYLKLKF